MSVLIKGMEMPRNCCNCDFETYSRGAHYCQIVMRATESLGRPGWCPLVEIILPNIVHWLNDIEIVRCRDCKYYKQQDDTCPYVGDDGYYREFPGEDDFCSKGERKESEE